MGEGCVLVDWRRTEAKRLCNFAARLFGGKEWMFQRVYTVRNFREDGLEPVVFRIKYTISPLLDFTLYSLVRLINSPVLTPVSN